MRSPSFVGGVDSAPEGEKSVFERHSRFGKITLALEELSIAAKHVEEVTTHGGTVGFLVVYIARPSHR